MSCPLSYSLNITGDCSNINVGTFELSILGTAPDYTIQWISPASYGTIALGPGVTTYSESGLSAATYTFNIIDSCEPNTVVPVNVYISSGTCVSIESFEDTLCGENNGSLSAVTSGYYGTATFSLYDSVYGFIMSASTAGNSYQFTNLSASTYYVIANDGGGCTGQSESVIIKDSSTIDFGFYVVNDAGCAVNSGKIFITGLTGNPPYTYLWSNGQTTSSISGLTAGFYNVTVTDSTGCAVNKVTSVSEVPSVGIASILTTDPSCYSSDGEITVIVTGGTSPYNFSASTLGNYFTFDTEYTFTNVSSGNYSILVTDAGLCTTSTTITVTTPGGFSVVSFSYSPTVCGASGYVTIVLNGGSPPYNYTLSETGGPTTTQTTNSSTWTFNNLFYGEYTLTISDDGPCEYSNTFTIENDNAFILSTSVTGTTCGDDNGIITVEVSGGTPSYTYTLDGSEIVISPLSSVTFTNLTSGLHSINVVDDNGCTQTISANVAISSDVDFILVPTDALGGNNGSVTALITSGEPPFTLTWSPNASGQTGSTITGLSAGTYSLTVVDDNGCESTTEVIVNGNVLLSSYQVYSVCDSDLLNYGEIILKGPKQMLLDGFYSLSSGDTNCILNQAIFEASVTVSGVTTTQTFFTGETLNDYPTTQQWNDVIGSLILGYDGIGSVIFDIETNQMTILTDCNSEISLNDADIIINMIIHYDISCVACYCPVPEFTPINCEITEEYCETEETKVIYDIKWPLFGIDLLDNLDIIPTRCQELPNYPDCGVIESKQIEFRNATNAYLSYINNYLLALSVGRISYAQSIPVVLPPSRYEGDYLYNGPENVGWTQFKVIQGCSCKKIFEENGLVGPQYDFDIVWLTEVQSYGDLPLTGNFGEFCFVIDDGVFYKWDPNTNTWINESSPIIGYPDIEDCAAVQRAQRDYYLLSLNQLMLVWRSFTWPSFHIPLYQIFKYNS